MAKIKKMEKYHVWVRMWSNQNSDTLDYGGVSWHTSFGDLKLKYAYLMSQQFHPEGYTLSRNACGAHQKLGTRMCMVDLSIIAKNKTIN